MPHDKSTKQDEDLNHVAVVGSVTSVTILTIGLCVLVDALAYIFD